MKREGKNIYSVRSVAIRLTASRRRRCMRFSAVSVGHAVKRRSVPSSTARSIGPSLPLGLLPLLLFFASAVQAQDNVRLSCVPRTFQVVPGEPVRVELTVEADSAAPIRLHLPADPLLLLRAVEKLPVQRTAAGVLVHKRVVIWQALGPGAVKLQAISLETQGRKRLFPELTILVLDPGL